jgi:hypothetical protein
MHLGADQGMSPVPLEIELTRIAANRTEHRRLLSEKVLDTSHRVATVRCGPVQRHFCLNPEPGLGPVWALRPNCGLHWGPVWFRCGLGHFQVWTWTRPQTRNLSHNRKNRLHNRVGLT